jgi:ATP-dependent DNA helicase RecG
VVCPRIGDDGDETDELDGDFDLGDSEPEERRPPVSVVDTFAALHDGPLAGLRMAMLHGRMPAGDKDATMLAFKAGEIDVLVSTTVIEVGVDVPNATLMIVMDADRFGISQLHQLRGRVGRGSAAGTCLLVTEALANSPARQRLDIVAGSTDGFILARADLELRREGDILGRVQAGRSSKLKLLSLLRDEPLIIAAREDAAALVDTDLALASYPGLREMAASMLDEESQEFLEKG